MSKFKTTLWHCTLYPLIGAGSLFVGIRIGRKKENTISFINNNNNYNNTLLNYPAFPSFATVSAATAVVPDKSIEVPNYPAGEPRIVRTSEIMKYGFPSLSNVRSYDDFVLSYDQRNRIAHWVFEHLTRDRLFYNKEINRSKCQFKEDNSIHSFFRATNNDYKQSGYDRGHLAAAGNHRICQEHVDQTFYLSNITPQVGPGFNRDIWNSLEKRVRNLTRSYKNVYVCTGPLFLPRVENDGNTYIKYQVIGPNYVAVPTHFFKIVVMETSEGNFEMESYVMPNTSIKNDTPLTTFQVPPETIERASGLLFFNRITRDKLVKINGRKCTYV